MVIDEIQRRPDLFPILRVLVDENPNRKFLILGSASQELIKQSSESLAGRIGYLELTPFDQSEVQNLKQLWIRGGFPKSFLADSDDTSYLWRREYVGTFLEQDIPNLGFKIPAQTMHRFWMMLTHYHGKMINYSEIGKSLGLSDMTIRRYMDILNGTFMVRILSPWHEALDKRQIKIPKIYFRDSGLYHFLSGVDSYKTLYTHPKLGASWEGFALEETIRMMDADRNDCYFWGIHRQAELDLMIIKNGRRYGFEFNFTDKPKLTRSIQISISALKLDRMTIVHPGKEQFKLEDSIDVIGLEGLIPL